MLIKLIRHKSVTKVTMILTIEYSIHKTVQILVVNKSASGVHSFNTLIKTDENKLKHGS